uniref:DUF506 domain-containing protein n=1 Tax=Araucaria cunninghamii TaxID=56994 RepID=A0A0D6QU04_ARACU
MPGLSKLGPHGFNKPDTADESYFTKSKSSLTHSLKWSREIAVGVPAGGLLNTRQVVSDHSPGLGDKGSHESDNDLAAMVRDFIENGSVGHDGSCHSSDSDPGTPSILKLAENIKALKASITPVERNLLYLVHHRIESIKAIELVCLSDSVCKCSCIRNLFVKHLRSRGYNAAVCKSEWKGFEENHEKVPGGEYEYMDVILEGDEGAPVRLIIDIDFQSHFEIARPTDSYGRILKSLPMIYVGGTVKLDRMLQLMVEAAKFSLKQNAMPLPPWRALGYLRAKWFSPYKRMDIETQSKHCTRSFHIDRRSADYCSKQLRRLKAYMLGEVDSGRDSGRGMLKTIPLERNRGMLSERRPNIFKA